MTEAEIIAQGLALERDYPLRSHPQPLCLVPVAPQQPVQVWYHGENCRDGFGAAYAPWTLYGDRARYLPLSDRVNPPATSPADAVFILDFSFPRDVLEKLNEEVASLVVIDHHASAQRELDGLDFAIFDMERSGAALAWQYFRPDLAVPELLLYVEDRDLWKWELPDSQEVNWFLRSHPLGDFEQWDRWVKAWASEEVFRMAVVAEGRAIRRLVNTAIAEDALSKAFAQRIGGQEFAVVNSPIFRSEIPDALREQGSPASATYADGPSGRSWSLRSDGSVDVSRIAERFGGGGHAEAAGFRESEPGEHVEIVWPVKAVEDE